MKIFISHAEKDDQLARRLTETLSQAGLDVWNPHQEIAPGDNWAMKVGTALEDSDLMVILMTHGSLQSELLKREFEYALTNERFQGRLISVFVGPTFDTTEVPWILLRQPMKQIASEREFPEIVDEIAALAH